MRRDDADGTSPLSQPRCEIEKTPLEGECQRPGEVRYKGIILLCGPHAALLQLEDRAQAVLGSVFQMDEWLEGNGSSGADEEYLGRIRHEREEAVCALRLIRGQIRSARKEVLQ
ncbi:MAG TPA: hypothetical protein VK902_01975 [Rubrobacter sp.]|nr:hypothetical protein [Rubrobacter sp.]